MLEIKERVGGQLKHEVDVELVHVRQLKWHVSHKCIFKKVPVGQLYCLYHKYEVLLALNDEVVNE